ncbi:MAG TPA: DNA polymerase Y family protein [Phycisphaerales bacterium]|nr:DNA polymerase Y family protein [Phycisphaerales bacterium]
MLLAATVAGRRLVAAACPLALRAGARPGMALADARAMLRTEPLVADAQPEKDATALLALARWAVRWSPVVSADQPDGLLLDVTGCAHLFGGEKRMMHAMRDSLARLGLTARVAVACTVGAAWAVARFGASAVAGVSPGGERAALSPLPVRALRIPEEAIAGLAEVGVETVGQLLALPRSALPARYGHAILLRIDQTLGAAFEPVDQLAEAVQFSASIDLPGGTTNTEALGLATRDVLADLSRQLARHESGARRVTISLKRIDEHAETVTVETARPTRDAAHLWALLRPRLERVHLGFGIECITAEAGAVSAVAHEQAALPSCAREPRPDERAFWAMVDTVANRIGRDRVRRPALAQSYRPERAVAFVPACAGPRVEPTPALDRPRPPRLLETPQPIEAVALSPDGPVVRFRYGGRWFDAARSIGPERLSGEWWRAREGHRDYFRVQDGYGRWLWIFRDCAGAWFCHGEWV